MVTSQKQQQKAEKHATNENDSLCSVIFKMRSSALVVCSPTHVFQACPSRFGQILYVRTSKRLRQKRPTSCTKMIHVILLSGVSFHPPHQRTRHNHCPEHSVKIFVHFSVCTGRSLFSANRGSVNSFFFLLVPRYFVIVAEGSYSKMSKNEELF